MKILKYKNSKGEYEDLYSVYKEDPYKDYDFNGYDFVDMEDAGIWCTHNVGANKPEERGLYFSWGEVIGYDESSQKPGGFKNDTYNYKNNPDTLPLDKDTAHANMGGKWRMPSIDEFIKLINLCDSEVIPEYNNSRVLSLKLKTDSSKQLILPIAGELDNEYGDGPTLIGDTCFYWSNSIDKSYPDDSAYILRSEGDLLTDSQDLRFKGLTIRAIYDSSIKSN